VPLGQIERVSKELDRVFIGHGSTVITGNHLST
jgi:hypothetical protein